MTPRTTGRADNTGAVRAQAAAIPRDRAPDSSLAFLREGYNLIGNRCRRYGSEIFETRLMLKRAVCVLGAEAANMFYGGDRFTRVGAMPITILKLLQDFGSVQLLDGEKHRHRKAMFLSIVTPEAVGQLVDTVRAAWEARLDEWLEREEIVLFDELRFILCMAVCDWAGVPPTEKDLAKRTREFGEMIEAAGSIGPRNWRAQWLRRRCEQWAKRRLAEIRSTEQPAAEGRPAQIIAHHRDLQGELLPLDVATVELINLLRATVAVSRYMVFVALALYEHAECRQRIAAGDDDYIEAFVQEVRRLYPFFSCIGGRVRKPFEWRGRFFETGDWVLLDLYGTNHDPRSHIDPERFDPGRRLRADPDNFAFIPQGGGDLRESHRCPGEGITSALMKLAAEMLVNEVRYEVPDQDLSIDLRRIPALPKSRFAMLVKGRSGTEHR